MATPKSEWNWSHIAGGHIIQKGGLKMKGSIIAGTAVHVNFDKRNKEHPDNLLRISV